MAVIVNKENDKNSDLSRRISADLREKAERKSGGFGSSKVRRDEDPDFIEGAEYIRDLKKTGKFGWVWILLVVLALAILIGVGVSVGGR